MGVWLFGSLVIVRTGERDVGGGGRGWSVCFLFLGHNGIVSRSRKWRFIGTSFVLGIKRGKMGC
jgi:hypothetical protein